MNTVVLTGDTTLTSLTRALQKLFDTSGETWTVVESDFNAWQRERIDPNSTFNSVRPNYLVYVLSPRVLTDVPDPLAACMRLLESFGDFTGNSEVLCTTMAVDPIHPMPLSETLNLHRVASQINTELFRFMQEHSWFHLLDQMAFHALHGITALTDRRFEILGRMYYSPKGAATLARSVHRALKALTRPPKKVLVLDLDQSLWGGTLGEDGLNGIRIGDEGLSYAFRLFQRALRVLKINGVLLAICSKNDEDHALSAIAAHPDMVLRLDDFLAHRINWNPKSENIRSMAEELGLGLSSFVLFDDSPFEREAILQLLPEVDVLDVPNDPADYIKCLCDYSGFDRLRVTHEDRNRSKIYQEDASRRALLKTSVSLEDFYTSLDMVAELSFLCEKDINRVQQLVSKTNQFNLTLKRYTEPEIREMNARPDAGILTLHLRDRLGENGLVVVAIVKMSSSGWDIDNFLMSCRTIGRTVEYGVLSRIASMARSSGVPVLTTSFTAGDRNSVARDFLLRSGFTWQEALGKWTLPLDGSEQKIPSSYVKISEPDRPNK
jgi:FkbH-like protein